MKASKKKGSEHRTENRTRDSICVDDGNGRYGIRRSQLAMLSNPASNQNKRHE